MVGTDEHVRGPYPFQDESRVARECAMTDTQTVMLNSGGQGALLESKTAGEKHPRRVFLMADYGSSGVWGHDGAPLDPGQLPISAQVRADLARWSARFQQLFETPAEVDAFVAEGRAIAHAIKIELPAWSVIYFDEAAAARAGYRGARAEYEAQIQSPA